ncbi:MAG: hypothetical protein P8Z30_20765 [Acidobacteriota bacterium]
MAGFCGLAASLAISVANFSFGQTQKIKGLLWAGGPDVIIKRQGTSAKVTATLHDSTKVRVTKGTFGLRKSSTSFAALMPSLHADVDAGPSGDGKLVARTVKFKAGYLKTANAIQAGLKATRQELAQAQRQDDCYESNARNARLRHGLWAT